jgi:hypothetical protein
LYDNPVVHGSVAEAEDGQSVVAVIVGVAITMAMAGVAGLVYDMGSDAGERSVAGPWGSLAFTAVIAAPAVVAVIGFQARPWVLGAAGVVQIPMVLLSFSFLFIPLWIPAVIFITQATLAPPTARRSPWQPLAAAAGALFLVASPLCLFVHQDPVSWSTANGSGSSSDVVTATEAALALACIAAAALVALAAPRDGSS